MMKKLKTYKQLFENNNLNFEYSEIFLLQDFKYMIEEYGINVVDNKKQSLLIYAIKVLTIKKIKNIKIVEYLLNQDIDVNMTDNMGNNALNWSAYFNLIDISQLLIDSNIDIDNKDDFGMTSLMTAASESYVESVEFLINNKCDYNLVCNQNKTALHYCANNLIYSFENYQTTLFLLLDTDINWNVKDDHDKYFLDYLTNEYVEEIKNKYPEKYNKYIREIKAKKFKI